MLAKVNMSTSSGNTIGYGLGDNEKEQRVEVTDSNGVLISQKDLAILNQSWQPGDLKTRAEVRDAASRVSKTISSQFDRCASMNNRVKNNTGHLIISHPPSDMKRLETLAISRGESVSEVRNQIDKEFLKEVGLDNTQYVIVQHRDRACPHEHIAYNRVQFDGKVVNSSFFKIRCMNASKKISEKYGLTVPELGLRNDVRQDEILTNKVAKAVSVSRSFNEFKQNVENSGVKVTEYFNKENGHRRGVSFSLPGERSIPGSRLSRSLSLPNIMRSLSANYNKSQKAKTESESKKHKAANHKPTPSRGRRR